MNSLPTQNYLSEHAAAVGIDIERLDGPSGTTERLLRLILDGNAKLPLDRVADMAAHYRMRCARFVSCSAHAVLQQRHHPPPEANACSAGK